MGRKFCHFANGIKMGNENTHSVVQHAFVGLIQEVTENPRMIWPPDLINPDEVPDQVKKDEMYALLVRHLRTLVDERDKLQELGGLQRAQSIRQGYFLGILQQIRGEHRRWLVNQTNN